MAKRRGRKKPWCRKKVSKFKNCCPVITITCRTQRKGIGPGLPTCMVRAGSHKRVFKKGAQAYNRAVKHAEALSRGQKRRSCKPRLKFGRGTR